MKIYSTCCLLALFSDQSCHIDGAEAVWSRFPGRTLGFISRSHLHPSAHPSVTMDAPVHVTEAYPNDHVVRYLMVPIIFHPYLKLYVEVWNLDAYSRVASLTSCTRLAAVYLGIIITSHFISQSGSICTRTVDAVRSGTSRRTLMQTGRAFCRKFSTG